MISHNPVFPLVGIYPKKAKTLIQKDLCTLMSTTALFTTAQIQKHFTGPLIDERIKTRCYVLLLAIKKTEICHVRQHGWA